MIEITPAILTDNLESFEMQISELFVFSKVDIDICREDFVNSKTLQISEIAKYIQEYKDVNFGFHLMVANPMEDLSLLTELGFATRELRIYIHQEIFDDSNSDLQEFRTFHWPATWTKGVCLKIETELNDADFYEEFEEIQLMTVEIGKQGGSFNEEVLETKVKRIKELGYSGTISIDGNVNLETADIIKQYPIDRVSVGSYFSSTSEDVRALKQLDQKLNS